MTFFLSMIVFLCVVMHGDVTVLLIDDSITIHRRVRQWLEEIPCVTSIDSAFSCEEALASIQQYPDVVLLDINLPDGNGLNLVEPIRRLLPNASIIVFSNASNRFYDVYCHQLGIQYILDKSYDIDKLPFILEEIAMESEMKNAS